MKPWDVAIIGGGLAGSAAALGLAQAGRKVILLEKEATAYDKVCGEFISQEAQRHLTELDVDLAALGATKITDIRLMRHKQLVSAPLPFHAQSLSRRLLDESILVRAEENGAQVVREAFVTSLIKEPSGWRMEIAGRETLHADTVFLATGKHEVRGWHRVSGSHNNFVGFKLHVHLAPEQRKNLEKHVDMFLFDGGYGGLEPIEEGKANLCLVVSKRRLIHYGKNWDHLYNKILETTPPLADRLNGATPCWPRPLSIFGIPYGFVYRPASNAPTKIYRLGDQMAVIPSFSGYGMSIALHTAKHAVKCYLQSDDVAYHNRTRIELLPLVRRATCLSKIAMLPVIQQILFSACRLRPQCITALAAHTHARQEPGLLPFD